MNLVRAGAAHDGFELAAAANHSGGNGFAQALQEVLNGNAAAWFTSTPKPAFAVLDNPDTLYLPVAKPVVGQRDAMAIRKGDTKSMAALNEWIAARKADGFLAERFSYWFEKRDWRALVQS